jgi:hypothetical protein
MVSQVKCIPPNKRINLMRRSATPGWKRTAHRLCVHRWTDTGKRMRLLVVLLLSLVGLSACAGSPTTGSSPPPTPLAAVAYDDPTALFAAVRDAGVRAEGFGEGDFSSVIPRSAHARRANFLIACPAGSLTLSDGTPATTLVAAVFADPASTDLGLPFGPHMAEALGSSVWQLRGPNWLMWSVERDGLEGVRDAIGGVLSSV